MGASQVISNRAPHIRLGPANQVGPEKGRYRNPHLLKVEEK